MRKPNDMTQQEHHAWLDYVAGIHYPAGDGPCVMPECCLTCDVCGQHTHSAVHECLDGDCRNSCMDCWGARP